MKQCITILLIITCFTLQLSAQEKKKKIWGEVNFAVEQNWMFGKQFNDPEINKMVPNMNVQYFMFGIDVRIVDEFGAFFNYGFGFRQHRKGFADDYNVFDQINLEEYYTENLKNKGNQTIHNKVTIGFFYRVHRKDWTFIPQVGFGVSYFSHSRLSYTLKKIDANDKYNVDYGINRRKKDEKDGIMSMVMLKLKAQRKLSKDFVLNFTAEYDFYIQKPKYTAQYHNFYNDALMESKSMKGNQLHGLAFGVGIGFR